MSTETLAAPQQTGEVISVDLASPRPELTVFEASSGWRLIDWRELWRYRDLFYFLVWRDVKVRYAQSILGIGWAVIRPVFSMIVFTVVFGNLAKVSSDGIPYAVFSYAALVPWTYFATALTGASGSLLGASGMISKIYLPRLVIPLSAVLSGLLDFAIAFLALLTALVAWQLNNKRTSRGSRVEAP